MKTFSSKGARRYAACATTEEFYRLPHKVTYQLFEQTAKPAYGKCRARLRRACQKLPQNGVPLILHLRRHSFAGRKVHGVLAIQQDRLCLVQR